MAEESNWQFNPEHSPGTVISPNSTPENNPSPQPAQLAPETESSEKPDNQSEFSFSWSASEFIAHQKNAGWYFLFFAGTVVLTALIFWITRDIFTSVLIALVGFAMGFFGARQPRSLSYSIDEQGVTIGQKFYGWELFKSFALIEEGAIDSIYLTPLKRFMPAISMYFEPKDANKITGIIGSVLPFEERTRDFVDNLMHKIRF